MVPTFSRRNISLQNTKANSFAHAQLIKLQRIRQPFRLLEIHENKYLREFNFADERDFDFSQELNFAASIKNREICNKKPFWYYISLLLRNVVV